MASARRSSTRVIGPARTAGLARADVRRALDPMRAICLGLAGGFALALCACSGPGAGPRDRVRQFAQCRVPAGAVQVNDLLQGDGVHWTFHAIVVMAPSRLPEFVEGCGFAMSDLRRGYEHEELRPIVENSEGTAAEEVSWWKLPEPAATAGAHRGRRHLLVVERDTDVAAFVYAQGP